MIMPTSAGQEYIPAKATSMKITVSRNCDQIFDRFERSQKCFPPVFALKKKKAKTSWYSPMTKASNDAIEIRIETPNIMLYASWAHMLDWDHGMMIEMILKMVNASVARNPARTKLRAICLPYTSPMISVIRKTNGK